MSRFAPLTGTRRRRAVSMSPRQRRRLAAWLRRTARHAHPDRRDLWVNDRVAMARPDLLAIARLIERAPHPDPAVVDDLVRLMSDGHGSPLLNAAIHASELRATLYYARERLATDVTVARRARATTEETEAQSA